MDTKEKNTCPVCNSTNIYNFITIKQVPLFCNVLLPAYDDAISVQKGDLRMCFCQACAHVFNSAFDPDLMNYTQAYENSLDFSPRFQDYAQSLAHYLIDHYDLKGKDIIEIACGKGDFLRYLCKIGDNRGIGFDPSYETRPDSINDNNDVTFIQDYYSGHYSHYKADFIYCRHALEHIQFPATFLESIRSTMGNQKDTVVFFEVPNVLYTLKDLGIWDLIYEHCSYFCPSSLERVFLMSEFDLLDLRETFNGQFLCVEAKPTQGTYNSHHARFGSVSQIAEYVSQFRDNYLSKVNYWKQEIGTLLQRGKRIVVWGGGSKGITFLNILRTHNHIEYIVDINPHKLDKFVPGSGQKVVSPQFLKEYSPDYVIIMNPIYQEEIKQHLININVSAQIILA